MIKFSISKRIDIISIIGIFLLALFIRIEYFLNTEIDNPIRGDAYYYMTYASNIDKYNIFSKDINTTNPKSDSYWAPGYPVFIVLVIKLSKLIKQNFYYTLIISQAFLGSLIAVLTFLIGRFFLTRPFILSAATLTALSPHLISLGNYVLTETLFSFCLLLSLYFFILLIKYKKIYWAVISGLTFGLSYLINPVIFFAPLLLMIFFYFSSKKNLYIKKLIIYMLISFLMIVFSWSVRNYLNVGDTKQSSSDRVLINLIIGSHHNFFDIWRTNSRDPNNPATLDQEEAQGSISKFLPILFNRIKENPIDYAEWYLLEKPYLLWSWNILIGQGDIYVYPVHQSLYNKSHLALVSYSIMKSAHLWLFFFSLMGVFFIYRSNNPKNKIEVLILYIVLFYVSSVYVLLQAEPRYSVPLRPEMYLCAMFFLSELVKRYKIYKQKEIK